MSTLLAVCFWYCDLLVHIDIVSLGLFTHNRTHNVDRLRFGSLFIFTWWNNLNWTTIEDKMPWTEGNNSFFHMFFLFASAITIWNKFAETRHELYLISHAMEIYMYTYSMRMVDALLLLLLFFCFCVVCCEFRIINRLMRNRRFCRHVCINSYING